MVENRAANQTFFVLAAWNFSYTISYQCSVCDPPPPVSPQQQETPAVCSEPLQTPLGDMGGVGLQNWIHHSEVTIRQTDRPGLEELKETCKNQLELVTWEFDLLVLGHCVSSFSSTKKKWRRTTSENPFFFLGSVCVCGSVAEGQPSTEFEP